MKVTTIEDIKTWRRQIHSHPELSLKEYKTAEYIRKQLDSFGLTYETPMDTATISFIDAGAKKNLLLRADIDALPINEKNKISFKSKYPGIMHACGHDAHTAMLLGATKEILDLKNKNKLNINVLIVFQPSEECVGGASELIKKFNFKKYNIIASFALHVNPDYNEGHIITKPGPLMASCNEFKVNYKGLSAHVGKREEGINAINAAFQVYSQFQAIPTYNLNSKHINIIHTGLINIGEVMNSVPEKGHMEGTIRTYDMSDLNITKERMKKICEGVSLSTGCDIELIFNDSYPAVVNENKLIPISKIATENISATFIEKEEPYLLAEDFSFFNEISPINYSFIGIRNEELGYTSGLHTPTLQMTEKALSYGVDYFVEIVKYYSKQQG